MAFQDSLDQWRIVFCVASIVATSTYVSFQIYGTAEIQPWNYPKKPADKEAEAKMLPNEASMNSAAIIDNNQFSDEGDDAEEILNLNVNGKDNW